MRVEVKPTGRKDLCGKSWVSRLRLSRAGGFRRHVRARLRYDLPHPPIRTGDQDRVPSLSPHEWQSWARRTHRLRATQAARPTGRGPPRICGERVRRGDCARTTRRYRARNHAGPAWSARRARRAGRRRGPVHRRRLGRDLVRHMESDGSQVGVPPGPTRTGGRGMRLGVKVTCERDGRFRASCPDLPGCVAHGRSREEALRNVDRLARGYLASLHVPLPERPGPVTVPVTGEPVATLPVPVTRVVPGHVNVQA